MHTFKKYIYLFLFFGVFFWLIFFLFWDEYKDFRENQLEITQYKQQLVEYHGNFHHEDIIKLWQSVYLHSTPDLEFLNKLVNHIDGADTRVWLEVYIFTEKRILESLIRAHKRGVNVKVLLENNPYMAPHLNNKHYETLQKAGIPVRWSDPLNYALNHSKFILIDEKVFISTGNYSYSSFNFNRDIFLEIHHKEIFDALKQLFLYDYNHTALWILHPNILISPDNSRQKIESLFTHATQSIDMYFPYIADRQLLALVIETAQRWIDIRFILWENAQENSQDEVKRLIDAWVDVFFMRRPKLHTKSILMDQEILYIWSINFSFHSMDSNREVWLLLKDAHIITEFKEIFDNDIFLLK